MAEFFTSDHHFGHKNVIEYCHRPFKSTDEMDEYMVHAWNETVAPDDTVWHLGDFSLSLKALPLVRQLNGHKFLVPGNHDKCHPASAKNAAKAANMRQVYRDAGFLNVWDGLMIPIDRDVGIRLHLSHMPYAGDTQYPDRYVQYRPTRGSETLLLHGHVHDHWLYKDRMYNVGVDVHDFRPVPLEKIIALARSAP